MERVGEVMRLSGLGMFAHWVNTHVEIPNAEETPFLIVFGDINMHPKIQRAQVKNYLGNDPKGKYQIRLRNGSR